MNVLVKDVSDFIDELLLGSYISCNHILLNYVVYFRFLRVMMMHDTDCHK